MAASDNNSDARSKDGLRPWMMSVLIFLAGQTFAAIWWASSINEKVKSVSLLEQQFQQVAVRVDTALGVLKDHGTQFNSLQQQIARLQGADDQIRADLTARAANRFNSEDWAVAQAVLDDRRQADLKIAELEREKLTARIAILEKELERIKQKGQ